MRPIALRRVEWFSTFFDRHFAAYQVHFYESNSQKSENLAMRQSFHFPKITGTWKFAKYLSLLQRTIGKKRIELKIKTFLTFFWPKKWAHWFLTCSKDNIFFYFLLIFSFTKPKNTFLTVAGLTIVFFIIVWPFQGNSQHFQRPCAKLKKQL